MEKLILKYETLIKAYKTLEIMITELNITCAEKESIQYIAFEDSVIKRFEYCYEETWKYLKEYLFVKYAVIANSPRATFQACLKQNITTEQQTSVLFGYDK